MSDIELSILNKEIIFILLLSKELKLDFKEMKKLFLGNDKIFFKYIYSLFPALKITEDRFIKLSKVSSVIHDKIVNNNVSISNKDNLNYEYVRRHIKNRYECRDTLYEYADILNYFENKHIRVDILLYNGNCIKNISKYDLDFYKTKIFKITINNLEESLVVFTNTSEYAFVAKDKQEHVEVKINIITKSTDKIEIHKKEDILHYVKEDSINVYKDFYIYCDLDLDIDMKCKNLYSECNLTLGNLDALHVVVKNLNVNSIKSTNVKVKNINARTIEIANKLIAENIKYYSICYAVNDIECKTIKGIRKNAKHFSLDGRVNISG